MIVVYKVDRLTRSLADFAKLVETFDAHGVSSACNHRLRLWADGNMSLKRALEELGFGPCHHMEEVFTNPEQVAHWQAIAADRLVQWDVVFAGYRSQVDWPGAHVWRETAIAYPNAKVIHTMRPEELWWKSFSTTIAKLMIDYKEMPLPPHVRAMVDVAMKLVAHKTFGGKFADKDGAIAAYRLRAEQVRAAIQPKRLLVFDVADGWEPLCRFLGHKIPNTPFPNTNSNEEFWKLVKGEPH